MKNAWGYVFFFFAEFIINMSDSAINIFETYEIIICCIGQHNNIAVYASQQDYPGIGSLLWVSAFLLAAPFSLL